MGTATMCILVAQQNLQTCRPSKRNYRLSPGNYKLVEDSGCFPPEVSETAAWNQVVRPSPKR